MCTRDVRCDDGLTACVACHGHGHLRMSGKPYKWNGHANMLASTTKVVHDECAGTGMDICGCVQFTDAEQVDLFGYVRHLSIEMVAA